MRHVSRSRRGFTLTELMVVLGIIAILVSLLVPALSYAMTRAREGAALAELNNVAIGLASFRAVYGTYPPSRIVVSESGDYSPAFFRSVLPPAAAAEAVALTPRTLSVFRQMFPRMALKTAAGGGPPPGTVYNVNGNLNPDGTEKLDPPYVLEGDQCLVLFLGGVPALNSGGYTPSGFSRDPANPFRSTASGSNRTAPFFPFAPGRVALYEGGRTGPLYTYANFPSYLDSLGGTSSPAPVVYFVAYPGGYDPNDVNFPAELLEVNASPVVEVFVSQAGAPAGAVTSTAPNPYTVGLPVENGSTTWQRAESYQLLSPGVDRVYGVGGQYKAGSAETLPYDADLAALRTGQPLRMLAGVRRWERDNLVNLTYGRLGQ